MLATFLRIAVELIFVAYCMSRLIRVRREKVCVTFLGFKYYKAEQRTLFWLAILAHVWISFAMVVNIVNDLSRL